MNFLCLTTPNRLRCFMLDTPNLPLDTAAEIAAAISAGRTSAQAVVETALARIRERDPILNSFTAVTEHRARLRAQAIDDTRARGEPLGPLAGVPFAVKNLFDIAGLPTLAGSKINRDDPPAKRDAALIERLEDAGAILVGALWANTPTTLPARTSTTARRAIRTISRA
jgi:1-carboxybiuret hydrolase